MTMKELASKIARIEGRKTQARIGEIREILAVISDIIYSEERADVYDLLCKNGARRAKRGKTVTVKFKNGTSMRVYKKKMR